jgi:nucleotide-binding universal stress UspA family protein
MTAMSADRPAKLRALSSADARRASRAGPQLRGTPNPIDQRTVEPQTATQIVAAVEAATVRETAATAASLARDLRAPLTFVCVRRHASSILGEPQYQRRLTRELFRARRTLDVALAAAASAGVMAHGEIVAGDAADGILTVATARPTRLIIVGRRRRMVGRSVSRRVVRHADMPVVVAADTAG